MTITQTVDIPVSRRITIDVPSEVPVGPVILTFTPAGNDKGTKYTTLSDKQAVSMTSEVIEKYRIALEDLAK